MTKFKTNLAYTAAVCFIAIGAAYQQPPEKTVQLPPVTVQQFNIIMQAFQECDCPVKSTPPLQQSFVDAARLQRPEWFGIKPDSAKKKP
jgi:hypothetical protein